MTSGFESNLTCCSLLEEDSANPSDSLTAGTESAAMILATTGSSLATARERTVERGAQKKTQVFFFYLPVSLPPLIFLLAMISSVRFELRIKIVRHPHLIGTKEVNTQARLPFFAEEKMGNKERLNNATELLECKVCQELILDTPPVSCR